MRPAFRRSGEATASVRNNGPRWPRRHLPEEHEKKKKTVDYWNVYTRTGIRGDF